jgi:PAS domain S-box-containing protein
MTPKLLRVPLFIFAIVFVILLVISQFVVYQQYNIFKEEKKSELVQEAGLVKDRFRDILFNDLAAANSLAIIYKQNGLRENFDSIAKQIIQTSPYVQALQITENGIVKNVYPDLSYKGTIGTNVNSDPERKAEEQRAGQRKDIYFAGPRRLRFGDIGILGKVPIMVDNKVKAIAVVLTRLSKITEALESGGRKKNKFVYQLLKRTAKDTSVFWLSRNKTGKPQPFVAVDIPEGDWQLHVTFDKHYDTDSFPYKLSGFGIMFSLAGAFLAYRKADEPFKLKQVINEKTRKLADSERYFRTLIENTTGVICLLDVNGKVTYQTPSCEKTTGYSLSARGNTAARELVHPDDKENDNLCYNEALNNPGKVVFRKVRIKHKNGHYIWIEGSYRNLLNDENVGAVVVNYDDITEKVKIEERLAKAFKELSLLNKIDDIILAEPDIHGLYSQVCRCIVESGGYPLAWICNKPEAADPDQTIEPLVAVGATDYMTGMKIDMVNPQLSSGPTGVVLHTGKTFVNNDASDATFFRPWVEKAMAHGIRSSIALCLEFGNNEIGALNVYAGQADAFDAHEVSLMERLAANVSLAVQHIRNREELRESEARFRGAFEESSIGVGFVSLTGAWLKVNRAFCEMLGYHEHEFLELTFQQITHPDDLEYDLKVLQQSISEGKNHHRFEKRYFHKDGSIVWVNLNVAMIRDQNKQPLYFVCQIENITDRIESQTKYQNLVENFIVGVYILQNYKLVYVNPRILEETGYTRAEVIDMPFNKFIYKDDLEYVWNIIDKRVNQGLETVRYEARIQLKNGQYSWYEILGGSTSYQGASALIGTMINIDERKEAEREIHRLNRLFQFISRMNESMLKSETEQDIYSEACRIAVEVGKFQLAWIGAYNEKNDQITPIAWAGYEGGFLDAVNVLGMKVYESAIPSARAIRKKAHFYYNDIANDPDIPDFIKQEMAEKQYLSGVSLPIFVDDKIVAAMVLLTSESFFFNEEEIALLRGVTENITYALDKIRIRELQNRSEADLRSIFDTTDVSYLLLDTNYNIVALNQHMKDLYKALVGVSLDKGVNLITALLPEKQEDAKSIYDRVIRTKQAEEYESTYLKDGTFQHFMLNVKHIESGNKVIGICISLIDITDRKNAVQQLEHLNESLLNQAKELEVSNAELEQFAYVASHDLQEPLRMVTSFLTQLEKKYGTLLDDKAKTYIHFATDGAKRMRQLILDLLEYSRVGRTESILEEINVNSLITEVLTLLRRNIEDSKASIRFKDMPTLNIYKTPMRQVFQNLIGNALKYQNPGVTPYIEISCKETSSNFQFTVTDNGIGIAPEYFDDIFIIFKRLHNRDEYSGTGMGLAVTKKIIDNFGGKIWVTSNNGEGSAFHFTIPKQLKR